MTMRLIDLVDVTDATLTAANIPETDYAEWSALTDYVAGDYVISVATHTVYRALVASGPGAGGAVDPDVEAANFADPLVDTSAATRYWQIIGATNLWRLFDSKPSVQATFADEIDVSITPGVRIDTLAVWNVDATSVQVIATSAASGEVYNVTKALIDTSGIDDWYEYFFSPVEELSETVFQDIPPYRDLTIQVIITRTGSNAMCGQITLGRAFPLGRTATDGTGSEGLDFSTIDTDIFGNLETTRRAAVRIIKFRVVTDTLRLNSVQRKLNEYRGGLPAVWLGADDERLGAQNYGFASDWRVDYVDTKARVSYLTIEVQGIA